MANVIELFAGAGGAALGLHRAGLDALLHIEWDEDAASTLRRADLGPVWQGDVREWTATTAHHFKGTDLLWSSFPCQAWSTAGKRLGAQDERNGWPWTVDAIDAIRPTWVACENVKGLTQHRKKANCDRNGSHPEDCPGCYLLGVILPQLRERFEWVSWRVLDAADYGVPQHRKRLIILAGPHEVEWPEATHGPGAALPYVTMGEALGFDCTVDHMRNTPANPRQERVRPSSEPSPAIGGKGNQIIRVIGGGSNPSRPGGKRTFRDLTDGPSTTIAAQVGGGAGNAGPFVVKYLDKPAPTVNAGEVKGSTLVNRTDGNPRLNRASCALHHDTGRRRLTVEECAILQDFPADHPWQGTKTSRYRQVGNAVPPRLAEVIARAIFS